MRSPPPPLYLFFISPLVVACVVLLTLMAGTAWRQTDPRSHTPIGWRTIHTVFPTYARSAALQQTNGVTDAKIRAERIADNNTSSSSSSSARWLRPKYSSSFVAAEKEEEEESFSLLLPYSLGGISPLFLSSFAVSPNHEGGEGGSEGHRHRHRKTPMEKENEGEEEKWFGFGQMWSHKISCFIVHANSGELPFPSTIKVVNPVSLLFCHLRGRRSSRSGGGFYSFPPRSSLRLVVSEEVINSSQQQTRRGRISFKKHIQQRRGEGEQDEYAPHTPQSDCWPNRSFVACGPAPTKKGGKKNGRTPLQTNSFVGTLGVTPSSLFIL